MKNTWIELDLDMLRGNLRSLKHALGAAVKIIFVVKANAYGHGMESVASCAWQCGVKWFAVAHVREGLTLRELLPDAHVIVVGAMDPSDTGTAVEKRLIPIIVSERHAQSLSSAAESRGSVLSCHAKIDTGMGRLGLIWEEAADILTRLQSKPGLDIVGMCTHFASAHDIGRSFADIQAERFLNVVQTCKERGLSIPFRHMSNSGAILSETAWDMEGVRPGILLYGYAPDSREPSASDKRKIKTRPFLQWKTHVVQVKKAPAGFPVSYDSTYVTEKETHIATIDAGYTDGYPRVLSNRSCVLVGGQRCSVIGRITMNLMTVNLGRETDVQERDEVILLGEQGGESIWADEIAKWCGTIPYEILTNLPQD